MPPCASAWEEVKTWVKSQWKNPRPPGQISVEINTHRPGRATGPSEALSRISVRIDGRSGPSLAAPSSASGRSSPRHRRARSACRSGWASAWSGPHASEGRLPDGICLTIIGTEGLRAEVIADSARLSGRSDETRKKLVAAIQRKQDQVSHIVNAITDAGHSPALLAKLQAEARDLETNLQALDDVGPLLRSTSRRISMR